MSDFDLTKDFDFADFGCSTGGSIQYGQDKFDGQKGVGFDIDSEKVKRTRENGYDAIEMDVLDLSLHPNSFRFVLMSHFLEHLPNQSVALKCMEAGVMAATEFVFIRQPLFADDYLAQFGLKFYWSDWTGHRNHMTILDFYKSIRSLQYEGGWRIYGWKPIQNSDHEFVHPIEGPINQHSYEVDKHGIKPSIAFDPNLYAEIMVLLYHSGVDPEPLEAKFKPAKLLLASESS